MTKNILFLLSFLVLALASCTKECEFPEDENTGDIIPDAIVYGGNTGGVPSAHHSVSGQYDLKVSFDNGYSYTTMDSSLYSQYSILNFPVKTGCNTHFERNVKVGSGNVVYTISVESCPDCEDEYVTDNWVLVKKFPANLTVDRIKKVK